MTFKIGDITIDRIEESCDIGSLPHVDFPDATPEALAPYMDWLKPFAIDPVSGGTIMPVQTYLVRTRHHTILLDTCVGHDKNHKDFPDWNQRSDYRLIEDLAAAGVTPEDIDFVLCSHLHLDHAGWNTQLIDGRWVPTFPNARYLFCQEELDFAEEEGAKGDTVYAESVHPVLEAGQGQIVAMDFALDDSIWLEPTAGHTPGHVATHITDGGQRAVMAGDLIHHPFQLPHPEWSPIYDWNPVMGAKTRRRFLESVAETDILVMTQHFPAPSSGHVFSRGSGFGMRYHGCDMVHG